METLWENPLGQLMLLWDWSATLLEGDEMGREERVRIITNIHVHGDNLDALLLQAYSMFDSFFGARDRYEIVRVDAKPAAQVLGGNVIIWEADVEAGEVWG